MSDITTSTVTVTGQSSPPSSVNQLISRSSGDALYPLKVTLASNVGKTATISSTKLQLNGKIVPKGLYRISVYQACTATGTGNVAVAVSWNDGASTRTNTSTTSFAALNFNQYVLVMVTDGMTDITYTATYTATGTYLLYLELERLI